MFHVICIVIFHRKYTDFNCCSLVSKPFTNKALLRVSRYFKSIPNLEFSLNKSRELAKHSLSEKEERLVVRKNSTGISTILELYGLITNDFTYKFRNKEVDSVELLKKYFYSSNAEDRELAYKSLFEPYKKNIEKFFLIGE